MSPKKEEVQWFDPQKVSMFWLSSFSLDHSTTQQWNNRYSKISLESRCFKCCSVQIKNSWWLDHQTMNLVLKRFVAFRTEIGFTIVMVEIEGQLFEMLPLCLIHQCFCQIFSDQGPVLSSSLMKLILKNFPNSFLRIWLA